MKFLNFSTKDLKLYLDFVMKMFSILTNNFKFSQGPQKYSTPRKRFSVTLNGWIWTLMEKKIASLLRKLKEVSKNK